MSILETPVAGPEICQNPWDSVGTAGMMWMDPAGRLRQLDKEVEEDTARDKGSEVRSSAAPVCKPALRLFNNNRLPFSRAPISQRVAAMSVLPWLCPQCLAEWPAQKSAPSIVEAGEVPNW